MAERVVKTARWLPEEWAVIERAAAAVGLAPTAWLRGEALSAARLVLGGAPAARVERESVRAGARAGRPAEDRADAPGHPDPGSTPGGSTGPASSRPAKPDLMSELKASLERVPPAESAGSGAAAASLPAAGRPSGAEPSSSSGSAPGRALVEVVAAGLAKRFGARADHAAAARRMVVTGRVSVDGVVVSDPGARISGGEDLVVA